MGSSEMDKPAKEKEKDSKTAPTSTPVYAFLVEALMISLRFSGMGNYLRFFLLFLCSTGAVFCH